MHILVIFREAFSTGWLGSTNRIFQLAEVLREDNHVVTLLTARYVDEKVQAEIDGVFPGNVFRTINSGCYPPIAEYSSITRRLWRGLWKLAGEEQYFCSLSLGWALAMEYDDTIGAIEKQHGPIDVVWGICGGYIDSLMAATSIAAQVKKPSILEMHDPPWHAGLKEDYRILTNVYRSLLGAATYIVTNTESYRIEIIRRFLVPEAQVVEIPQCFEYTEKSINGSSNDFCILYAGTVSTERSIAPLLHSLAKLGESKSLQLRPVLNVYGAGNGIRDMQKLATSLSLKGQYSYHGYVGKSVISRETAIADLNVIIQSDEASVYEVPGKLFECIGAGKPIMGIMRDCEASRIIECSGVGKTFPSHKTEEMALFIKECMNMKIMKKPIRYDRQYLGKFSRDRFSSSVRSLISGCCDKAE
jgi:glycosyltransferase involved in cell wall biosynthesis